MALNRKMLEDNETNGYARNDQYNPAVVKSIADKYRAILRDLGESPEREGLAKTPERVAKALQFLTHGYDLDPAGILRSAQICFPPRAAHSELLFFCSVTLTCGAR